MKNYILQIDTATEVCSVSLSLDGNVINMIDAEEPNLHASKLTVFIDQLLQNVNVTYSDLSAVAVSKGPGSYTGLRIGVSVAKGLCYALDIPLLAVNTLTSMYEGFLNNKEQGEMMLYIPMLDARRMEVYMMVFDHQGTVLRSTEAVIVDENTFANYTTQKICLFGTGADKLKSLLSDNAYVLIDSDYKHSSTFLTKSAYQKYLEKDFEDLIYFEPYYLKEFIATTPKSIKL